MAHLQRNQTMELTDFERRFLEERRAMTAGIKSQMSGLNASENGDDRPSFISADDRADLSITMDRNDASMLYQADEGRRVTAADLIDKMNMGDNVTVIDGEKRRTVVKEMQLEDGTIVHKDIGDLKDSMSSMDSRTRDLIMNPDSHIDY